jgi:spermidine synthase
MLFSLGASVGFYPIFGFTFLTLAPYAGLVGFVLAYSLFLLRARCPDYPGVRIYMADNLGDVGGGALFAFVLIVIATPMQAMLAANLLLTVLAARLVARPWLGIVGAAAVLAVLVTGTVTETALLQPAVGRLIHYEESRYARLTVHQDQEQITLFADGRPVYTSQDWTLAEETAHYPLSQIQHPNRILLVSSVAGLMEEVAKHRPRSIDYVELDEAVSRLLFQYGLMPAPSGINVIHGDARTWLRQSPGPYDAILVSLPDPDTFQLNRFFTDGFFKLVQARLTPKGIFSFSVEGFENYMTAAQRLKVSSLRVTVQRHFKQVQLLPGQRIFFLCRQTPLDLDIPGLLAREGVATRYVAPYFEGNISAERRAGLAADLIADIPLNTDTRPYLMRLMFGQWFTKFGTSAKGFAIVLAVVFGVYLLRLPREAFVLFTTGLMSMGSEILVIFAFQIFLGYIYFKIGIIVTVFLVGLLPGAWWGHRWISKSTFFLMLSDLGLIGLILIFIAALHVIGDGLPQGFFYAGGFLISLLCGFQFPLALAQAGQSNRAAAGIFAVDLVGAACGALVVSTVLIPYLGLEGAAGVLIGIKIISLLVMGGRYAANRPTHLSGG